MPPKLRSKTVILTDQAPKPIGPYSQGMIANGFLFCSGMVPLDLETGAVVSANEIVGQAQQVMKNIEAVLNAAHCSFESVVKTTIFLKSMSDFSKVNEVYATYFKSSHPARSTVEVSRLPKDVWVEIEVIAFVG
jgi:2-iminobutanoate/2-iminopropanoate deaminase